MNKYLLSFLTVLAISFATADLHAKDVSGLSMSSATLKAEDAGYKIKIGLKPINKQKQGFQSLEDFLAYLTADATYALNFTRQLYKVADKHKLNVYGFEFTEGKDTKGDLSFYFLANKDAEADPEEEEILLTQGYDPNHSFQKFFDDPNECLKLSKHTISFTSLSGNILVVPRGTYLSLYDFSKKASQAEIVDFWQFVQHYAKDLENKNIQYVINTHAGSHGHQTVPHFHLRFKINPS